MYLVICESKVTGLSIDDWYKTKKEAEICANNLNKNCSFNSKNKYHVKEFKLEDIDIHKLM